MSQDSESVLEINAADVACSHVAMYPGSMKQSNLMKLEEEDRFSGLMDNGRNKD